MAAHALEEAALREAMANRSTAAMLEAAAQQHEKLAATLAAVDDAHTAEERASLLEDAAAMRTLQRGMAAAAGILSYDSVQAYWADLLGHYAALQTFTPRIDPRAVPASKLDGWFDWLG